MENLIDRIFKNVWNESFASIDAGNEFFPRVNAYKKEDNVVMNVYYPGVSKDEIKVKIEDEFLLIQGDFETKKDDGIEEYIREFQPINFSRSFKLPKDVKKKAISANYKDGVLSVVIPIDKKKERERKININIE